MNVDIAVVKDMNNLLRKHMKAIDALFELHKPIDCQILDHKYTGCNSCVEWSHEGNSNLHYPCPTIQAIQEQLK